MASESDNLLDSILNNLNNVANVADKVNDTYLNIKNGTQSQEHIQAQQQSSGVLGTFYGLNDNNKTLLYIAGAGALIVIMLFLGRK